MNNRNASALRFSLRLSCGHNFLSIFRRSAANFNKVWILTKDAVNPKGRENQKNSCISGKLALTNLKRSGFVFINDDLNFLKKILNTKRSAAVFLMRVRLCKRLIAGLAKRFGYFGAPKYHASRHRAKKINIYL